MKEIITNISSLNKPAKNLEFITETGIDKTEGEKIVSELKEVLAANTGVIAISAPQIGIDARIVCIRFNDIIKTFINPIVTKKDKYSIGPETCSSMPGKEIITSRPEDITVVYYTDEFVYEDNKLVGPAARLFEQQLQLLDGVTPADVGLVSDIEEDGPVSALSEEEFKQVVDIYTKFVDAKKKALEASLEQDEELNKQYRQMKFAENVINGRTVVIDPESDAKNKKAKQMAEKSIFMAGKAAKMAQQAQFREFARKKSR